MRVQFFTVPVQDPGAEQEALNRFLDAHRVLSVDREFVTDGRQSLWCFCITYADGEAPATSRPGKGGIDYRQVLNEADFEIFARLRKLRKELADRDATPAYNIFNNEQLADMVRNQVDSIAGLLALGGVGQARVEKYGALFLDELAKARADVQAKKLETPGAPRAD